MSRFRYGFDENELSQFYRLWIKQNGNGRDSDDQRFGQTLCNCYLVPGASFPELFYEESAWEAYVKAYTEIKVQ